MDKLRRMEIFKAVAEAGQFSRAADNLRLSKSAVSHAISDLEKFLGTQLVTRNTRRLQLTSDGERYYQNCRHILSEVNAVENEFRKQAPDVEGPVGVTAPISYGVSKISPILAEFMRDNPKVTLTLSLSETNVDLVQAGLDMAIRIGHLQNSSMKAQRLSDVAMVLIASPDFVLSNPHIKSISDLNTVNCLRYRWTPKWNFIKAGKTVSHTPKGAVTSDSGEALLEFTAHGHGVSFLPDFIVQSAMKAGRVVQLLPDYEAERFPVHAVLPPNSQRAARVKRLLDYFVKRFDAKAPVVEWEVG